MEGIDIFEAFINQSIKDYIVDNTVVRLHSLTEYVEYEHIHVIEECHTCGDDVDVDIRLKDEVGSEINVIYNVIDKICSIMDDSLDLSLTQLSFSEIIGTFGVGFKDKDKTIANNLINYLSKYADINRDGLYELAISDKQLFTTIIQG